MLHTQLADTSRWVQMVQLTQAWQDKLERTLEWLLEINSTSDQLELTRVRKWDLRIAKCTRYSILRSTSKDTLKDIKYHKDCNQE